MRSFWTLTQVPPGSWAPTEVWLLEHALALRRSAERDDPVRQTINGVLEQIRATSMRSPSGAFRMALTILRYGSVGEQTMFALEAMEIAMQAGCQISATEELEAVQSCSRLLQSSRFVNRVQNLLKRLGRESSGHASLLPKRVMQESSESLGLSSPIRSPISTQALSPHEARSPGKSLSLPLLHQKEPVNEPDEEPRAWPPSLEEREYFPKDRPQPNAKWHRPRQIFSKPWQPLFDGTQFQIATGDARPVGHKYFLEYERCHPCTF